MPSQTPILEVSHLPSASSFYAAITQPLGLQYLYASSPSSPIACLHYGTVSDTGKNIVFSIAQANTSRIVPSNICLDAPSAKALVDFHKKSEKLNTEWKQHSIERIEDQGIEYLIAQIADLDGNMIQAAHSQAARAPSMAGSQAGSRVLDWQEDVARSVVSGSGAGSQASGSTVTRAYPHRSQTAPTPSSRVLERQTITTESYRRQHPEVRPEMARSISQGAVPPVTAEKGISSKAVIGTLLGAAAGAVFAYAMVRSESPEPVASAPMPVPEAPMRGVSYVGGTSASPGRAMSAAESYHREHNVVERIPARSYISEREGSSQADVRPRYVERYSVVGGQGERGLERIDEGSYVSGSGYSKAMTTRPLEIMPASSQVSTGSKRSSGSKHHSSHHSSHHSAHESVVSGSHAPSHRDDASYHSARSSRTESTIVPANSKAARSEHSNYVTAAPSKVGSSTTTIKLSPSKVGSKAGSVRPTQVELPRSVVDGSRAAGSRSGGSRSGGSRVDGGSRVGGSRSGSVRASQVELPQSVVDEEGYGGYEYEASVAPSDSVSSVGSKMERLRLVGRMGRFTG